MSDESVGNEGAGDGLAGRPSRARYDRVRVALDGKWRRREPQPERMLREVVEALWDAFEPAGWSAVRVWLADGEGALKAGHGLPAPETSPAASGAARARESNATVVEVGAAFTPVSDLDGRVWAVLETRSPGGFDEMDARWLERLVKPLAVSDES